ncbi:bifunctional cobalt-precorrin-7 (C(5))-methyltransferase CbiE/decarboxylating cobalt-precorrin-6B (C(15))-methyltransferase CbiT [Actinomadura spongiicola]|uniref:Bifunctional cobalt-precorrin-7 (C(5))-methyltransferase CbiE/decarboxylating cobalt-precorrin-6B (C(15))-methyltransferase CbiT n=1 Tax=Actinomadura spongiicola TaxID=2303421 RepID=A0A372GCS0_9ACTN|nr:bifunctional cobalt-precorrin-7 (C(5))-methyltransferase CbiE/decarboxylating cobalt-precorrin-6B (C(15))-methyltransferase CbiT [Actinomadura spongiicola]RFS83140.1 bifunctional cobalt-precorrin-7 (C(5))-methyltransferase CbiE/decarboxylating cobalt-precorrin-6B (C(15))-methyltransferase CbiT [Actinomadura spongiicola]
MLTVVGRTGPSLGEAARAAVESAAVVIGEPGRLDGLPSAPDAETVVTDDPVDALQGVDVTDQDVVLVVDGDPGCFGVLRVLLEKGHAPEVVPAVPLVARAFAQAGLPWDDAMVVSARDGHLRQAVNVCRAHPKVAVLTGPGAGPAELARALFPVTPRSFIVCEDLDGPRERVVYVRPAEATTRPWNDPNVVLVLDNRHALGEPTWIAGAAPGPAGWALPADAFGGGDGLRPDVRAFVLAKLGPRVGDMVWDVESGDGSVGIECARFGAAVVAVDRDYAACERIRANVRRHGVKVAMASGDVRSTAGHLPEPDAVFVGPGFAGPGGPDAVRVCAALDPARLVAVVPDAAMAEPLLDVLVEHGYTAAAVRLQATPLTAPTEPSDAPAPVIVVWGERDVPAPGRPASRTIRPVETIPALPGDPDDPPVQRT